MNIKKVIVVLLISLCPLSVIGEQSVVREEGSIIYPNIDVSRSCKKYLTKKSSDSLSQLKRISLVRARRCTISISPYIVSRCLVNPSILCTSYSLEDFFLERTREKSGFRRVFKKTKSLNFNEITEIKKLRIRLKPRDINNFKLIYETPDALDSPSDNTSKDNTEICNEIKKNIEKEYNSISSCTTDSECGQFIRGTSCGCDNDLVARKSANLSSFYELFNLKLSNNCKSLDYVTTCDCKIAKGFKCVKFRCEINI